MSFRDRKLFVAGSLLLLISVAAPGLASAATGERTSAVLASAAATLTAAHRNAGSIENAGSMEKACPSVPKPKSGQVVVPIVVDFGSDESTVDVTCVAVPAGSNGSDVLSTRASVLRTKQPMYNSSGLLCQIDGYPSSGCGAQTGSHYAYWAYFHGGRTWSYANDGPAENRVSTGDVEGWRFEPDGSATPSDPPPRAPSSASILETLPVTTTTTTTTTTPTTTTTTTRPANHTPSTTATSSTPTSTTSRPSSQKKVASKGSPPSGGGSKDSAGHSSRSVNAGGGNSASGGAPAGNGAAATAAGAVSGGASSEQDGSSGLAVAGVSRANRGGSSGSGGDVVLGLAGLVIVLGVVFALFHSRRRLGTER